MKKIADWPLWAQLSAIGAVIAALAALGTNMQAIAESPFQPFALKYQIAGIAESLTSIQFKALKKELNDLRSQRLMLKEAIERETNPDEKRQKALRLESIEIDIRDGDADYVKLRCQIETTAACP